MYQPFSPAHRLKVESVDLSQPVENLLEGMCKMILGQVFGAIQSHRPSNLLGQLFGRLNDLCHDVLLSGSYQSSRLLLLLLLWLVNLRYYLIFIQVFNV